MRSELAILLLWLFATGMPTSVAAECLPADFDEAKRRADYIFEATLKMELDLDTGETGAYMQVHRVWRGSVFEQPRVHYTRGRDPVGLSPRTRYLMFARRQTPEDRLAGNIAAHVPQRLMWLPRCAALPSDEKAARAIAESLGQSVGPLSAGPPINLTLSHYQYRAAATRVTVTVWGYGGSITATWGAAAESMGAVGPSPSDRARELTPEETADVRRMVAAAALFDGGHIGADLRRADLFLEILKVTEERTVVLVTSANATFGAGPRKVLVDWLREQQNTLRKELR
jgi:hypothetical protein